MSSASVSPTGGNPVLTGKIALVTGAYGDIGQHTVLGLARAGATVVAAGRDHAKLGLLARNAAAQVPGAQIETLVLDLADLASVQRAADTVLATARPVDVLVNNAAVMPGGQRQTTHDGFELAFGTNHLGHYALTGHLLPALLTSPGARVITVCAGPPNQRLDTSDLNSERRYRGGMRTYMASKLATAVYAQELARRAAGTTVRSMTANPGVAATGVQRHNPVIGWLARYVFAPIASSPEQAARPSLYAATRASLDNGTLVGPAGPLGIKGAPGPRKLPAAVADKAIGQRLWQASETLTGVHYHLNRPGPPEGDR
jgi:NAD(P)-dependent dehydrogenase (short-subunit alcohol dehydrogenase family)